MYRYNKSLISYVKLSIKKRLYNYQKSTTMKNLLFLLIAIIALPLAAQENDYYVKKGFAVEGYDVTEYFNNKAVEG